MKNLLFILLALSVGLSSCRYGFGRRIKGNGNITTQEHSVSSFKDVQASGAVELYLAQGDIKPVKIETDENLQQYIEVIEEGNRIVIKTRRNINLRPTHKVKVYVTAPVFNEIDVSGASNIYTQSKIVNAENMSVQLSGAGTISMELNAPKVKADVSGAGTVNLKGETKAFDLLLTGAGNANCYDFMSEDTRVDISGAGDANVFASVKLEAQVSGAGTVRYKGGATNVNQHVSGAGSVKKDD